MTKNRNKPGRTSRRSSRRPSGGTQSGTPVEQTVRISSLGRHCDGVAVTDDADGKGGCFVPFALPDERVRVQTTGKRAKLLEVLESSPDRAQPICQHFGHCGGCAAQHLKDAPYRTWKRSVVETALRNKGHDVIVDELIDAHGEGRRRVTFHVQFSKNKILVGFMQARSRELVNVDTCPILAPTLHEAPQVARILATPFAKQATPLDIAFTDTPDGLDCDIRGVGDIDYDTHVAIAEAAEQCDLARVSFNGDMELERRKPRLVIGTTRVPMPTGCFLQATMTGEETIAQLVLSEIGSVKKVADLFCGVGPFALRLASTVSVYAADSNATAIAALNEAVRFGENLKPVEAVVVDLFRNPIYHDDLNRFDAIIFNPARAGAEAQSEEISASNVPLVICVSCDPASLARDASILVDGGYTFERAMPVDQFKYSPHVETIAIFRRN